jgi:hypothetical protein
MSKPSHIAYVVTSPKEEAEWREIGAVWPRSNGKGFELVIYDQISVSGRIVCTEPEDKPADKKASA